MKKLYVPWDATDELMYKEIYASGTRIFIADEIVGKYFIKKSCDLFLIS